jgi:hypothetical protein
MVPFILGLLVGLSVTGGWKWLKIILPIYVISMVVVQLLTSAIANNKKPEMNAKEAIQEAAIQSIENSIDKTAVGLKRGEKAYDIGISILIPIVLILSLSTVIYQIVLNDYMRAISTFILFALLMLVRDIRREKNA